jgi:hypothetical protein
VESTSAMNSRNLVITRLETRFGTIGIGGCRTLSDNIMEGRITETEQCIVKRDKSADDEKERKQENSQDTVE